MIRSHTANLIINLFSTPLVHYPASFDFYFYCRFFCFTSLGVCVSPSSLLLVQHDLNSQFKLPLTPNCEGTGGWLRLQGIHFILSTWTAAGRRRLLLHRGISAHMRQHYPLVHSSPHPPRTGRLKRGRHTLLPADILKIHAGNSVAGFWLGKNGRKNKEGFCTPTIQLDDPLDKT